MTFNHIQSHGNINYHYIYFYTVFKKIQFWLNFIFAWEYFHFVFFSFTNLKERKQNRLNLFNIIFEIIKYINFYEGRQISQDKLLHYLLNYQGIAMYLNIQ